MSVLIFTRYDDYVNKIKDTINMFMFVETKECEKDYTHYIFLMQHVDFKEYAVSIKSLHNRYTIATQSLHKDQKIKGKIRIL